MADTANNTRTFSSLFDKLQSVGETPLTTTQIERKRKIQEAALQAEIFSVEEDIEMIDEAISNTLNSSEPNWGSITVQAGKKAARIAALAALKSAGKAYFETEVDIESTPLVVQVVQ